MQTDHTLDNKEIRGFTWRQAGWVLGALMTIEATVVGGFLSIKQELAQNTKDNASQESRIAEIKVEQDRLKEHDIKQDAQIEFLFNVRPTQPTP